MPTISVTNLRKNIYKTMEEVNKSSQPVLVTNEKGGNAVLLSEKDYESLQETIYLMSSKETREEIAAGLVTPIEDCVDGDEVDL